MGLGQMERPGPQKESPRGHFMGSFNGKRRQGSRCPLLREKEKRPFCLANESQVLRPIWVAPAMAGSRAC